MVLFARADAAVVAFHQDLVDALQRHPLWFARVCLLALAAVMACRAIAYDRAGFWLALDALMLAGLWFDCRSSAFLATIGSVRWVRCLGLVFILLDVLFALLVPSPARVLQLMISVLLTAFFYFAACRPPKPPLPRGRFAMGGA